MTKEDAHEWLDAVRKAITDYANDAEHEVRDYACTLLFALVGVEAAVFLQIGDGVIVVNDQDSTLVVGVLAGTRRIRKHDLLRD